MSQRRHLLEADCASLDLILSNLDGALFDLRQYRNARTAGAPELYVAARAVAGIEDAEKAMRSLRTALALELANLPKE